mgnify:CR=1 FL=1
MNEVKGEKVEEYIRNLESRYLLKLREYIYDFLKILEKNSSNNNDNIQNEKSIYTIQNYNNLKEKILINLKNFHLVLFKIVFKDINFLPFDYVKIPLNNNKSFEKNHFTIKILQIINTTENVFAKNILKNEIRANEFKTIRNIIRQKIEESKSINDYINEYITNDFKESPIEKKSNDDNPPQIYFNCKESAEYEFVEINIKISIFDIYIKMPFNKLFNLYNFYNKIFFTIKKNTSLYSFQKGNIKYPEKLLKNDSFENLLLIKYIRNLYLEKSYIIIKMIIMQSPKEESRKTFVGKDVLIEFCKRFIYYIHDYNKLFTAKCSICGNSAKFSLKEKCFFPPFYKIYKEKELIDSINNSKGNSINLFSHAECLKKWDFSY